MVAAGADMPTTRRKERRTADVENGRKRKMGVVFSAEQWGLFHGERVMSLMVVSVGIGSCGGSWF